MSEIRETIRGGDYAAAGAGSRRIKAALKRIGVDPKIVRRAMIATYEAEMNVVIHAYEGTVRAALTPDALEVVIADRGPGIPDLEQALREGYSTAPAEARALGFGAGMGLPNIRRNTDRFTIHSTVDSGTRLRFTVYLNPEVRSVSTLVSLRVHAEKCIRCLRCVHACPTQAIRIRSQGVSIMQHLCIGCTACMSVCPAAVYELDCPQTLPEPDEATALVLPPALRGQFGGPVSGQALTAWLDTQGWHRVLFTDPWETAVSEASEQWAGKRSDRGPVIAPVCEAVINLIRSRYPALLGQVTPCLTPFESALHALDAGHLAVAAACPAQCAVATAPGALNRTESVAPTALIPVLMPHRGQFIRTEGAPAPAPTPQGSALRIFGIERVCQFLDAAENGRMDDCAVVELYACDLGCFGTPVWKEHPAVAQYRSRLAADERPAAPEALRRVNPLEARAGLRLDLDMAKAIEKLTRIDRLAATLPGRDCSVCGAPSCLALAEDIVMGRARENACLFRNKPAEPEPNETSKESES